ncbi:TetR family transcriptional regulator [Streptomyces sp. NPDC006197]|uniref:TetR family transcriptional regulator n=1 Tax=Streptomyces sp. NPDC006197 TaxID=3156685 RepID=UPI0033AF0F48
MRSAAESFAREGFAVVSLTGISTRSGVSNDALHFHFAGKTALAEAAEEAAPARLQAMAGEKSPGAPSRLQHLVERVLRGPVLR